MPELKGLTTEELNNLFDRGLIDKNELRKAMGITQETFSWTKFKKIFSLGSGVEWVKDINSLVNLRKIIIYLLAISLFFGYGWWKGKGNTPVKVDIGYGKECYIKLNGDSLHITKDGSIYIEDTKTGEVKKQVKVKDVPGLQKLLSPIGLKLEPFIWGGYGANLEGQNNQVEGGLGVSLVRIYKISLDALISTYPAVYIGASYSITSNSGIGIAVGKGIQEGDNRAIIYYRFRF